MRLRIRKSGVRPGRALALAAVACAMSGAAVAKDMRDGLGLAAGLSTGLGFSYIHHTAHGFAGQATGILLKSNQNAWYDAGVGLQRTLAGGSLTRVYAGLDAATYHRTHPLTPPTVDWNIGLGLGIETLWHGSYGLSAEVQEMWKTRQGDVVLAPAIAVRYYF